jgi:hypothetical protein
MTWHIWRKGIVAHVVADCTWWGIEASALDLQEAEHENMLEHAREWAINCRPKGAYGWWSGLRLAKNDEKFEERLLRARMNAACYTEELKIAR